MWAQSGVTRVAALGSTIEEVVESGGMGGQQPTG